MNLRHRREASRNSVALARFMGVTVAQMEMWLAALEAERAEWRHDNERMRAERNKIRMCKPQVTK